MRIELSRIIRRRGGILLIYLYYDDDDDDPELFQDIERARRKETDGLLDPLSPMSHVRCPDLLWVSLDHLLPSLGSLNIILIFLSGTKWRWWLT